MRVRGSGDLLYAAADPNKWVHPLEGLNGDEVEALRPLDANFYWTAEINGHWVLFYRSVWIYGWLTKRKATRTVERLNRKVQKAIERGEELPQVPERHGDRRFRVIGDGWSSNHNYAWQREMSRIEFAPAERRFRERQRKAGVENS